jgi:HNH endonuclease
MPWANDRESRRRSDATYQNPEYKRNREAARRRANGRCEGCHHPHGRLQCDHIVNYAVSRSHALANLQMLCVGAGSCRCHEKKTAQEGGGFRNGQRATDPGLETRTAW